MEKHLFKTTSGMEVELTEKDMHEIHQHYIEQCTADYLRENYPDWTEEKIQVIAIEARRQMLKYEFTEEEAIEEALESYEEEDIKVQNEAESIEAQESENNVPAHRRHRGR